MKLTVLADKQDFQWLSYILDEFVRVQQAKFTIAVIGDSVPIHEDSIGVLYYSDHSKGKIPYLRRKQVNPLGAQLQYIDAKMFVLKHTIFDDEKSIFPYDIFWNAFVFLSRYEEYLSEQKGQFINSYCRNHPREDKLSFGFPIVSIYFELLEDKIRSLFPEFGFSDSRSSRVELSHDLDYVEKTSAVRIKQTAFNLFNTFKYFHQPKIFGRNFQKTVRFLFSQPSYWCFDYWVDLELSFEVRSVFYVFAKTGRRSMRHWLLDPSYDVSKNQKLQNQLGRMIDQGFEVGLHGSFDSATKKSSLEEEKKTLEEALKIKVIKTRQHWLRFRELITPRLHEDLFEFDSTIGWNDRMSFRAGIAAQYRPYDHECNRPFDFYVTPLVIMDSNIYDYGSGAEERRFEQGRELLSWMRQLKTFFVSISWHPRTCSTDYNWHWSYKKYLEEIQQSCKYGCNS